MSTTILNRLLQQWEESFKTGQPIPPESLCSQHPDLLPQLRALIAARTDTSTPGTNIPRDPTYTDTNVLAAVVGSAEKLPQTIGNYKVLRLLGIGGMGAVFLAEDAGLGRQVAIKTLKPEYAVRPDARARFFREARSQAAVEHEHIVSIYGVGEENGIPYLVMPVLRGESLDDRLRRETRLPIQETLRIGREIAEGLAAAHQRGLIHRDIKPANIWLSAGGKVNGTVKILDFGLARIADNSETNLTATGAVMGTPAYLAPELTDGEKATHRSDLFSLGCILHQMAIGEKPFDGPSVLTILSKLASHTPPALIERDGSIPVELSIIVQQLLEKNPAHRPADATIVVTALQQAELRLSQGSGLSSSRFQLPPTQPSGGIRFSQSSSSPTIPQPVVVPQALPLTSMDNAEKTVIVRGSTPMPAPPKPATAADPWEQLDTTDAIPNALPAEPRTFPGKKKPFPMWYVAGGSVLLGSIVLALLLLSGGDKKPAVSEGTTPQATEPAPPSKTTKPLPKSTPPPPAKPTALLTAADIREPIPRPAIPWLSLNPATIPPDERAVLPPMTVGLIGSHRGTFSIGDYQRAALSPDGKWLASANDAGVSLMETATLLPRLFIPAAECWCVAFSGDAKTLGIGHVQGVILVDLSGPQPRIVPQRFADQVERNVTALAFAKDSSLFVTATLHGGIYVWDRAAKDNKPLYILRAPEPLVPNKPAVYAVKLVITEDHNRVAAQICDTGPCTTVIRVWEMDKEGIRELGSVPSSAMLSPSFALTKDGRNLIVGTNLELVNPEPIKIFQVTPSGIVPRDGAIPNIVARVDEFVDQDRTLVVKSLTGLQLWQTQPLVRKLRDLPIDTRFVFPDAEKILTVTAGTVAVRELLTNRPIVSAAPPIATPSHEIGFSANYIFATAAKQIYSITPTGLRTTALDSETAALLQEPINRLAFAPDETRIAGLRAKGELHILSNAAGAVKFEQALLDQPDRRADSGLFRAIAWHPDSRHLFAVTKDDFLEKIDISVRPANRTVLAKLGWQEVPRALAVGFNGNFVALIDEGKYVVFDLRTNPPTRRELAPIPPIPKTWIPSFALVFHPNGGTLLASKVGWDGHSFDLLQDAPTPTPFPPATSTARFSPDGRLLLTIGTGILVIHEWANNYRTLVQIPCPGVIRTAEWAGDGKHILAHVDGVIYILRLPLP